MSLDRARLRDLGVPIGTIETGRRNAITDVPGVRVGHVTLNARTGYPDSVCTGVTAILPHGGDLFQQKLCAASHLINGFGKTAGLVQLDELGELESPILLTNTFGVGAALEGGVRYLIARDERVGDTLPTPNVIVGECNDGYLNAQRDLPVRPHHVIAAIENASDGPVPEGAVGAGTGMRCCGWKGGIGTASRHVPRSDYTVGVLVLSNFGGPEDLTVLGVPVGRHLRPDDFLPQDGSIILVVATDLPWDALALRRLAARTAFGLARIGSVASHGSGDIAIAFSTAESARPAYADGGRLATDAFHAVAEATEEAILNSLFQAQTTIGREGRVVLALPIEETIALLQPEPAPKGDA
ncbi:MAG: P1 family peptidase [Thermaerobacter sp.]|nr:P1 family peptidase [Thermaerobacter sp.]